MIFKLVTSKTTSEPQQPQNPGRQARKLSKDIGDKHK